MPAGIFLSGPLVLKSSINIQLDSGAILRILPFGSYPLTYFTNYTTNATIITTNVTCTVQHFITGTNRHDIEVSGSGTIDGQGLPWWPHYSTAGRLGSLPFHSFTAIARVPLAQPARFMTRNVGSSATTTIEPGGLGLSLDTKGWSIQPRPAPDAWELCRWLR